MNVSSPPTEVVATVADYAPSHVQREDWAEIAGSVREAVLRTTTTRPAALKVLPVLASFGVWMSAEGYEVSIDILQRMALIERYIATGMTDAPDSTRATRRAILRRVAARLDPDPAPEPEAIRYSRAKAPYTPWETARYFDLARTQPTAARCESVQSLLALGLGCGLDRTDLAWVRGTDVSLITSASTVVKVIGGSRPRAVVALEEYAQLIRDCADQAGENLLIGGTRLGRRNVTTPLLERLIRDASLPRLAPARLRSTWLVRHLTLGTPLSVLLPAAGLASSRTLDDLLEYADPVSADLAVQQLSGRPA